jgi:hypothetical protein
MRGAALAGMDGRLRPLLLKILLACVFGLCGRQVYPECTWLCVPDSPSYELILMSAAY